MAISRTTRTHLIYQFIILTLLFLGIGYNELLPDRKFILFLAFIPMFCYQLIILSCCMELLPVPSWMNLGESTSKKESTKTEETGSDSLPSSPVASSSRNFSQAQAEKKIIDFPDMSDKIQGSRRWEKSVVNLGASPKLSYPQKSKSWMNLSESKKSATEKSLSREGSLDALGPVSERKCRSHLSKVDKLNHREERANKVKSWKPSCSSFGVSVDKTEVRHPTEMSTVEHAKHPLSSCSTVQHEESQLAKSYSFPFRQKRLETWLEFKETSTGESNQSLDVPYWQSVGYNLAVKYEARRRTRAVSSPTKRNVSCEIPLQTLNLQNSVEIPTESACSSKQSQKKNPKSASTCINKIKMSFTNLISKKKDEASENANANFNKGLKPTLSLKSKNKTFQFSKKEENSSIVSDFPQFLSNDRPLIFYPKHIPFEKERFESDVQKKMLELAAEPKGSLQRFGTR